MNQEAQIEMPVARQEPVAKARKLTEKFVKAIERLDLTKQDKKNVVRNLIEEFEVGVDV